MRKWRHWPRPTIIWLFRLRKRKWPKSRTSSLPIAGAPPKTARWGLRKPVRLPLGMFALYGLGLVIAFGILLKIPARSSKTLPVTGNLGPPRARASWLNSTIKRLPVGPSSVRSWMNQAIPLLGNLDKAHHSMVWDAKTIMIAAIQDISGVQLTSLSAILQMEIPGMAAAHTKGKPTALPTSQKSSHKPLPRTSAQDAIMQGLPGDKGRVWAELGTKPVVGIYQTHSYESFWPSLSGGVSTAYSTQWSKTIVQVGWWLAQDMHQAGVGVVQSRVNNMSEGVLASYSKSYYTAKQLLRWYPSVRVLLDVHRGQGPLKDTTATVHGVKMGNIQIIVGTNKLLPNPYWHQNLQFAMHLATALKSVAPGILRGKGIDMVPYRYNQQIMPADLLVEIGGDHNTLAEERYAAHELSLALAQVIRQHHVP